MTTPHGPQATKGVWGTTTVLSWMTVGPAG
jgi:hypothetical protein